MKCKFWNKKGFYVLNKQAIAHCENEGKCPKGTDVDCNITHKPKRTVTVKAWAYLSYGQVEIQRHNCIQPSFPCSIVMLKEDWDYLNT